MTPEMITQVKKMIQDALDAYALYSNKKLGDTPNDALQLTPQKYVDANGTRANRPKTPNVGQQYFSTQDHYPWFSDGISSWFSATGSIVAGI